MKIRRGSIEILGYIGLILWVSIILQRMWGSSVSDVDTFIIGIAPNIGAAWLVTLIGKLIVIFGFKQDLTIKKHFLICAGVLSIALISEIFYYVFFHRAFDMWDIIATVVAQLIIFTLPLLTKDKYFANYNQIPVEQSMKKRIALGLLGLICGVAILVLELFVFQKPDGILGMWICFVGIYLFLANTIRLCMINGHFADIIMDLLSTIANWF